MPKLRLLISGSLLNTNTVGSFITRNLEDSVEFEILAFHDKFSELIASWYNKLIYRFFSWWIVSKMDALFLKQVKSFKPHVVVIFKGGEISKSALIEARKYGVKLANYNMDHPFMHFSRGTGNKYVTEAIPFYDLHISYSSFIAKELNEKFRVATAVLPFGFHLTREQYLAVVNENRPEIQEVCFVGNPDYLRLNIIKEVIAEKIKINLYGFGWEKFFSESEWVVIHRPRKEASYWSDPLEFWMVLRQYRVQLNFLRPHNEGSHNLRTFEVPAVGGILLTSDSEEQRQFFERDNEVFLYSDVKDMIHQCRKLLDMDRNQVEHVRERARNKSLSKDYSYKRRTNDLVQMLINLNEGKIKNEFVK